MTAPDLVTRLWEKARTLTTRAPGDYGDTVVLTEREFRELLREAADALEQVTKMKDAYKVAAERQYDEVQALTAALTVAETERTMLRRRDA